MGIYRCLFIVLYGLLFSIPSGSETNSETPKELSCETLTFFFSIWQDSAFGKNPTGVERAAWIIRNPNGDQIFQKWRNSGERNKELWKGPVPPNVVGVVHTHPAHRDSKPSPADVAMAKRVKIDVYVVSVDGLWMSNPKGKISRVMAYVDFKKSVTSCRSEE